MLRKHLKPKQDSGIRALWLWVWAVASVLYAIPVLMLVIVPIPDEQEVKRLWAYDSLTLAAEQRGEPPPRGKLKTLFENLSEDQILADLDRFWAGEAQDHAKPGAPELDFVRRVREMNTYYRVRIANLPRERQQAEIAGLLAWSCPVTAGMLGIWLAGRWRLRRERKKAEAAGQ